MAKESQKSAILLLIIILSSSISNSERLQSSQANTLLKIQSLLNFPSILSSWNKKTDFCNLDPTSTFTIVCYENSITQLHIVGHEEGSPKLPNNFSIDSLITNLSKLPSLKVLTLVSLGLWGSIPGKIEGLSSIEVLNISSNYLDGNLPKEISSLTNLQGIILDDNNFSGQIPDLFGSFPALNVLSLRNNFFNGSLPGSLSKLSGLRVLRISNNHLSGEVPDLRGLKDLEELDLESNSLGPNFPQLGNKLVKITLRNNKFRSGIPDEISSYYQLQKLDISSNKFMGPFPMTVFSLPSISYLNISENQFTGKLSKNMPCSDSLSFVDLSSNLVTGELPECIISKSKNRVFRYKGNCLDHVGDGSQHEYGFCRNEALAAGVVPNLQKKQKRERKAILASCIVSGIVGVILVVGLGFWVLKNVLAKKKKLEARSSPRVIAEKASIGYSSKLITDARYISQTVKLGALGIPAYRTFSLEELEGATNHFSSTAFMGEGSHGQMYRGQLRDGSLVAIRCLKLKQSYTTDHFMPHLELISQLRHRHLVSAIGHCFECYLEDSTVSRLFLVFEYVSNGTLRHWISAGRGRRRFSWSERITASIGILKGIQFLHTGVIPGIFSNNLRITDVLIDQNLAAKIKSSSLPLLAQDIAMDGHRTSMGSKEICTRVDHEDKADIYDFGVILLEVIMGIPIKSRSDLNITRNQVQATLAGDEAARRSIVAEEIEKTSSDQSLKTMMEICVRCLRKDPSERPSVEDVLWNLQFASQVQDAWQGGESFSSVKDSSSLSPPHLPRFRLTYH